MAVLALAGTGLGLHLGKSAIDEINPAYFSTPMPGSRFHADLVPNSPDRNSAPGLRDAAFSSAYAVECVGCRTYPEEYVPVPDISVQAFADDYAAEDISYAVDIIEDVDREIAEVARRAARETVARYAHFPVSSEEKPEEFAYAADDHKEQAEETGDCDLEASCASGAAPGI